MASIPILSRFAREDPAKHVVITSLTRLDRQQFVHFLSQRLALTAGEALLFVHGYNNTFEYACKRTAQIAHDLEFPGVPMMYSWPSAGSAAQYTVDDGNADWSLPHFEKFLQMVAKETGARTVHLVAHSTGSRLLAKTLEAMARSRGQRIAFEQVVFAAADVDAADFRAQYVPAIASLAKRITMYVSAADKALLASQKLRKYPRAGEAGANMLVMEGIDTIDVSPIDTTFLGHSYLTTKPVFQDLLNLLRSGGGPGERCGSLPKCYLEALRWTNGLAYWRFIKSGP
jgi:esterase/lipase superfamily enzyme